MINSVIAGTGNSRYLRTNIPTGTTWADALALLRAGTFPIDLAGINSDGFVTVGTALTSDTLLKSAVIQRLGLDESATLSDAWEAILDLLDDKQGELTFDNVPTQGSPNPVRSGGLYTALNGKQDALTFDTRPTPGSTNPVTSGGVADAIAGATTMTTTLSIPASAWHGDDPYTASITVSGYSVTPDTRVDVACNYTTMNALTNMGVSAIYVENNAGTLTAYSLGAAPNTAISVNALLYETTSI